MSLFWRRKNPKKEPKYEMQKFNIGVTTARVTFSDGREFTFKIYGHLSTYIRQQLTTSKYYAEQWLTYYVGGDTSYTDDIKNPTVSVWGNAVKKEILGTEDYFEEYKVEVE